MNRASHSGGSRWRRLVLNNSSLHVRVYIKLFRVFEFRNSHFGGVHLRNRETVSHRAFAKLSLFRAEHCPWHAMPICHGINGMPWHATPKPRHAHAACATGTGATPPRRGLVSRSRHSPVVGTHFTLQPSLARFGEMAGYLMAKSWRNLPWPPAGDRL